MTTLQKFYRNKRVFVTGGAGFIGSFLVEELLKLGAKVTVMARKKSSLWRIRGLRRVRIVKSHLGDPKLNLVLKREHPDIIFNLAAVIDISNKPPEMLPEIIKPEVDNTLNILTSALYANVQRFIHIGSSKEYGVIPVPFKETQHENPSFPYATAKVISSHLVSLTHKISPMQTCVIRLPTVYGPRQTTSLLIPNLIKSCMRRIDFSMNPGLQMWDFLYVEDAVKGILLAGAQKSVQGQILNIGSNKPVRIKDVVNKINRKMGSPIKVIFGAVKYRSFDTPKHFMDSRQAMQLLNWRPQTSIDTGISKTVKWYKENSKIDVLPHK